MKHIVVCLGLLVPGYLATALAIEPQSQATSSTESCLLLFELGVGEVRRGPAEACRTRVTPASTFKVPHALAALEEQQSFLVKLYEDRLPIAPAAAKAVREMVIEPPGVVVNAAGRHSFNAPWPAGTVVSGKTGSATDASGRGVRWLIGHIKTGSRSHVFVSCVIGPRELAPNAAIDLAVRSLRDAQIL